MLAHAGMLSIYKETAMDNDKCDKAMESFLALDKNEWLPFSVTVHLLTCKKCRTQVRLCTLAEKAAAAPLNVHMPLSDNALYAIMTRIDPRYIEHEQERIPTISFTRWVIFGLIMIGAMLVFGVFQNSISQLVVISFYIVFACVITAYCALFIGSNMDFFIKKFETFKQSGQV